MILEQNGIPIKSDNVITYVNIQGHVFVSFLFLCIGSIFISNCVVSLQPNAFKNVFQVHVVNHD